MVLEESPVVIDNRRARFSGVAWFMQDAPEVFIIGAGSIGSFLALSLARIGCKLHIWDFDSIEEVNYAAQWFNLNQLKRLKVEALKENIELFSGNENVYIYPKKYDKNEMVAPIMFLCADSMECRSTAFYKWKVQDERELFVDSRNSIELMECYAVTKENEDEYEKTLYTDSEANDLPCNLKSTNHCCMISSGLMVGCFTNYLTNMNLGFDLRVIPFYQSFEIPFFSYEIKL